MTNFQKFEKVSYYTIIVFCMSVITYALFFDGDSVRDELIQKTDDGLKLEQLAKASSFDKTLILTVSPTCPFCNRSLSFYKELVDFRNSNNISLGIISANSSANDINVERAVFEEESIVLDDMTSFGELGLQIKYVPTILLVSRDGEIEKTWSGYQEEAAREEIFQSLNGI